MRQPSSRRTWYITTLAWATATSSLACREPSSTDNSPVDARESLAQVGGEGAECANCVLGPVRASVSSEEPTVGFDFEGSRTGSYELVVSHIFTTSARGSLILNGRRIIDLEALAEVDSRALELNVELAATNRLELQSTAGSASVELSVHSGVRRVDGRGGTVRTPDGSIAVSIPAGAFARPTQVKITAFTESSLESQIGRNVPTTWRYLSGVKLETGGIGLMKPVVVRAALAGTDSSVKQLLVGIVDESLPRSASFLLHEPAPSESSVLAEEAPMKTEAQTFVAFQTQRPGSFGVVAPVVPQVLVAGRLLVPTGQPLVGALVTSAGSPLLSALTDARGRYVVPGGAGDYAVLGAIAPSAVACLVQHGNPCPGALLIGLNLPQPRPIFPGLPFPVIDHVVDALEDLANIEDAADPRQGCVPSAPGNPRFAMIERPPSASGYDFSVGETVHFSLLYGFLGVFGDTFGNRNSLQAKAANLALTLVSFAVTGSIDVWEQLYLHLGDSGVARFANPTPILPIGANSDDGTVEGVGYGSTTLSGFIQYTEILGLAVGLPVPCPVTAYAAPVSLTAFEITTANPLPAGVVGLSYSSGSFSTNTGVSPIAYSVTGIPPGLQLASNGQSIQGTPSSPGAYRVSIRAVDASLPIAVRDTKIFDLVISPGSGPPPVAPAAYFVVTSTYEDYLQAGNGGFYVNYCGGTKYGLYGQISCVNAAPPGQGGPPYIVATDPTLDSVFVPRPGMVISSSVGSNFASVDATIDRSAFNAHFQSPYGDYFGRNMSATIKIFVRGGPGTQFQYVESVFSNVSASKSSGVSCYNSGPGTWGARFGTYSVYARATGDANQASGLVPQTVTGATTFPLTSFAGEQYSYAGSATVSGAVDHGAPICEDQVTAQAKAIGTLTVVVK